MNEARAAKERPNLGKEIKIGVSVVVVLLGIFGYVIYTKFFQKPAVPVVAAKAPVPAEAKPKERLASGPAEPKVVSPQPAASSAPSATSSSRKSRPDPAASANVSLPATSPGTQSAGSGRSDRYRDRYGSGPPSYSYSSDSAASDAAASPRNSTMPTDPYAYSATPPSGPSDPYALDEPQGAPATSSDGRTPARVAPADSPYGSRPNNMPADPYARSTSRGPAQTAAQPAQQPPAAPASQYSSARSYDMYGRGANGAVTPPATPPQSMPHRPHATSVAFGNTAPQGEIERSTDEYQVQPNDSYWTISQKLYGNGAYFKALFEHNRKEIPRPDQLKPGMTISAPSTAALRQTYADLCPSEEHAAVAAQTSMISTSGSRLTSGARTYLVEEGDTLFDIARFELGRASRWAEIYDLNRDQIGQNVDYLRPGLELMLPPDGSDTSVTSRPEPTRHRE